MGRVCLVGLTDVSATVMLVILAVEGVVNAVLGEGRGRNSDSKVPKRTKARLLVGESSD